MASIKDSHVLISGTRELLPYCERVVAGVIKLMILRLGEIVLHYLSNHKDPYKREARRSRKKKGMG